MFVSDCLSLNDQGHLVIGNRDTVELAQTFGTPLYVMDENQIRKNCRSYKNSIDKFYEGRGIACFASKAFSCKAMCKIAKEEGMGLDVVSAGELYTAMSVNFPKEKIFFHGNNKSVEELTYALECDIGCIVVDNISELEILSQLAVSQNKKANIMFRIKPGIDAHTHDFVKTGQIDSKFGFAIETGEAMEVIKKAVSMPSINLKGIHCHIGSQIFDIDPFELAAEVMIGLIAKAKAETGYEMQQLNLGGGFGIKYLPEHDPVEYENYMQQVSDVVKSACKKHNVATPFIVLEPGRSIVGPAGITLYKVGAVKKIPNIRTYVSVDGGMGDNPRYALYKSPYDFCIANKAALAKDATVTVAGKCCESGDLLGEGVQLQNAQPGDIMAVLATGAYNYSMSSNYNRNPKPAVVLVNGDGARIIVKRETYEDIVRNDIE